MLRRTPCNAAVVICNETSATVTFGTNVMKPVLPTVTYDVNVIQPVLQ